MPLRILIRKVENIGSHTLFSHLSAMANLTITFMFLMLPMLFAAVEVGAQKQPSNITLGSILYPNRNPSSWLSSSGHFAFGFYSIGDGFQVGIWFEKTVVWTASRDDPPVHSDGYLEFTKEGKLILWTKQNMKVIAESPKPVTSASMLDSGNFVIYNKTDVVWESFDYPTDTLLVGQRLISGHSLVSSVSEIDHSIGRFYLSMQADGNLVAYPTNYINRPEASYWAFMLQSRGEFGEVDSVFVSLTPRGQLFRNASNDFGFQVNEIANSSTRTPNKTVIYRATLDPDGIFRLYTHSFEGRDESSLEINWSSLENQCQARGFCGVNSYCTARNGSSTGACSCLPGFLYVNHEMKFQGCYRGFVYEESCGSSNSTVLAYNLTMIQHLKLGGYPFSQVSIVEQDCRKSCLEDCTCWATQYVNGVCSKFKLPLIYSTLDPTDQSVKAFVKQSYNISQIAGHTVPNPGKAGNRNKSRKEIILILSLALGSVAFLLTVVAICSYLFYRSNEGQYQKLLENPYLGPNEEFTLRSFSYSELEKATEHFKEEIRHGSFGNLYKGILSEGNRTIAVKRLEKMGDEAEREFKAEMTAIGQARHKNLVHLLGFCLEGSEKILVYEYTSNGSLADILFNSETRPSWEQRMRLALDISRGILYLHEECETCIIHCNIKPHNILVDDLWTAKISDFGLAKFLVPNQVGNQLQLKTRGYLAPELQNSATISDKVDVYSYGVMLLEIICCRSNMDVNVSTEDEIFLPTWVHKCFVENDLKKLVGDEEVDVKSLERTVKVGLLCIHDNPDLRPSMRNVVLMLEGIMDIPFLAYTNIV
ncbi:G-type lectin S-receptor-like serine/threonine-protein kinase LECRK1 [Nicotiana tomentosiformis]|uniref:G-type lectin S-receptor-like serine/threonine-protein kinase LECRK1 n=1 Tax=Nicotiana tomentosiformis TaxID=4098 RepID=UPI0014455295|nr:G-type lectin S-receptor-like serine/threonine-protein kinase LECRK1 [Nicotiana tomentosiformis]